MRYEAFAADHCIEIRNATSIPHPADMVGGLIAGFRVGSLRIITGIAAGPISVAIEVRDEMPSRQIASEWEDVAEISLEHFGHPAEVVGPYEPSGYAPPLFGTCDERSYRLRVHAKGRDADEDGVLETVGAESYFLQVWPARMARPAVISLGSGVSRWHESHPIQFPPGESAVLTDTRAVPVGHSWSSAQHVDEGLLLAEEENIRRHRREGG